MPSWLLWLGAVSYSLYLVHVTVIQLVGATPVWADGAWLAVPVVAMSSLVTAGVLHRYVERPATEQGRKLTSSHPERVKVVETSGSPTRLPGRLS